MSGAGTEVGRISVKVTPDTDEFRRLLLKKLKEIENSVRGKVPVEADMSGFREEVKAKSSKLPKAKVKVDADLDNVSAMRKKLELLNLGFERRMKNALGVKDLMPINFQEAQRKLDTLNLNWDKRVQKFLNDIKPKPIKLTVDPEFDYKLRQRLSKLNAPVKMEPKLDGFQQKALADLQKYSKTIEAKIPLSPDGERFRQHVRAQIAWLEKSIKAEIPVDLKLAAGQRAQIAAQLAGFKKLSEGFENFTDSAEKAGGEVEHVGRKFLGLTRMGWLVAAVFTAAAPAIGLVSGLIAGLPSLIGMFGAGIGAVALGMDGIKAAAAPLAPLFESLKSSVSGTWETGLAPVVEQFKSVFPALERGMAPVVSGLTMMAQGFTDVLTSSTGLQKLEGFLANTGSFFMSLSPMVSQFTDAFLTAAQAGSSAFGYLSNSLNQFAEGFNGVIQRVTANGVFDQAMRGLSETFNGFGDLFNRLFDSGLQAMGQLGGPIETMLSGIGDALVAAMPALTSFSSLIGNVVGALGTSLAPVITALTPAFTELTNILSTTLSGTLQTLSPVITQIAQALGSSLLIALQQLTPLLPGLLQSFSQLATSFTTQLAPMLPQIVTSFGQLLALLIQLGPQFLKILTEAVIPMVPGLVRLATASLPVTIAFAQLASAIMPLLPALIQMATPLATLGNLFGVVRTALSALGSAFDEIRAKIAEWVTSFITSVGEVVAEADTIPGKIKAALGQMAQIGLQAGKDLIQGIINGIGSMVGAAVDAARNVASSVAGAVKNFLGINSPSKLFTDFGEFTMQGFANGIESAGQDAVSKVKEIAKAIFEAAKEVFGNAGGMNLAFNFGGMGGGFGGMANQMSSIASSAGDFQKSLSNSVNPAKKIDAASQQQLDTLQIQKDELELQRQQLQAQKNLLDPKDKAGRAALQQQMDALTMQKQQLELDYQQLKYAAKYEGSITGTNEQYGEMLNKATKMPYDFAMSNANQAMQDLGISGNGALPTIAKTALDYGSKFIFNVSNVDEAMAVKNNQIQKESLQYNGR